MTSTTGKPPNATVNRALSDLRSTQCSAGRYRTSSRRADLVAVPGSRVEVHPDYTLRADEGDLVLRRFLRHQHLGGCVLDPLDASSNWEIHGYSDSCAIVDDRRI